MKILKPLTLLFSAIIITSCGTQQKNILWVNSQKVECYGVGKTQCMQVYKGEDLDNAKWELFYGQIEGFTFEEGYLTKLEIKEEQIENPPADASSTRVIMLKALEKIADYSANTNGSWVLTKLNDAPINKATKLPTLNINLSKMQVSGFGGCNTFSGAIKKLTHNSVGFGNLATTNKACANPNIEQEFYQALNSINTYQIKGNTFTLYNTDGKKVLAFMKHKEEGTTALNGNWQAIKIEGQPINRMAKTPTLIIDTKANRVSGNNGCNNFTGEFKVSEANKIQIGALATTKMLCRKMDVPTAFNKAMAKVVTYKINDDTLALLDANSNEVLHFLKAKAE